MSHSGKIGRIAALALCYLVLPPRLSRADAVYGLWNGTVSGYIEVTEGDQTLSNQLINEQGTLSISFTTVSVDPPLGELELTMTGLSYPLESDTTNVLGPQSASLFLSYTGYFYSTTVYLFATYPEILPDGWIVDGGTGTAVANINLFSAYTDVSNGELVSTIEILNFQNVVPEPPSIVLACSALAFGLVFAPRTGFQVLKNLITPRSRKGVDRVLSANLLDHP